MPKRICCGLLCAFALVAFALNTACRKAEEPALPGFRVVITGADGHGKTTLLAAITEVLAQRGLADQRSYDDLVAAGGAGSAEIAYDSAGHRIALIDYASHAGIMAALSDAASAVDAVILVVAQAEGIRQQTRDQIAAAGEAGIPAVLVFQSKDDWVDDAELKDLEQSEIEQALVESGLMAEEDAGTWEGGSFKPGAAEVFRGSALRALDGDAAARAPIEALVDAIDRLAAAG